jgi:hypothetical protein
MIRLLDLILEIIWESDVPDEVKRIASREQGGHVAWGHYFRADGFHWDRNLNDWVPPSEDDLTSPKTFEAPPIRGTSGKIRRDKDELVPRGIHPWEKTEEEISQIDYRDAASRYFHEKAHNVTSGFLDGIRKIFVSGERTPKHSSDYGGGKERLERPKEFEGIALQRIIRSVYDSSAMPDQYDDFESFSNQYSNNSFATSAVLCDLLIHCITAKNGNIELAPDLLVDLEASMENYSHDRSKLLHDLVEYSVDVSAPEKNRRAVRDSLNKSIEVQITAIKRLPVFNESHRLLRALSIAILSGESTAAKRVIGELREKFPQDTSREELEKHLVMDPEYVRKFPPSRRVWQEKAPPIIDKPSDASKPLSLSLFHGGTPGIETFDVGKPSFNTEPGFATKPVRRQAIFLSDNEKFSIVFANRYKNAALYTIEVELKQMAVLDASLLLEFADEIGFFDEYDSNDHTHKVLVNFFLGNPKNNEVSIEFHPTQLNREELRAKELPDWMWNLFDDDEHDDPDYYGDAYDVDIPPPGTGSRFTSWLRGRGIDAVKFKEDRPDGSASGNTVAIIDPTAIRKATECEAPLTPENKLIKLTGKLFRDYQRADRRTDPTELRKKAGWISQYLIAGRNIGECLNCGRPISNSYINNDATTCNDCKGSITVSWWNSEGFNNPDKLTLNLPGYTPPSSPSREDLEAQLEKFKEKTLSDFYDYYLRYHNHEGEEAKVEQVRSIVQYGPTHPAYSVYLIQRQRLDPNFDVGELNSSFFDQHITYRDSDGKEHTAQLRSIAYYGPEHPAYSIYLAKRKEYDPEEDARDQVNINYHLNISGQH